MKIRTLRLRMMLLFCTVVGVLLAASYLAFWGLLAHAVHTQLNRQLLETARPIIADMVDRKSTRLNSSHTVISYAVFCLKKKKKQKTDYHTTNSNDKM